MPMTLFFCKSRSRQQTNNEYVLADDENIVQVGSARRNARNLVVLGELK